MFERFTDRGRRVVVLAQEEARLLRHNYIGTEHLLLGLVHEGEGIGAQVLESLGVSLTDARAQVEEIIGHGSDATSGHIPFTPHAKKVLEFSLREALELGHNYIGTEHILLGLIREREGVAAQVLTKLGAELPTVRQLVVQVVAEHDGPPPAPSRMNVAAATFGTTATRVGGAPGLHCSFCGRDLWEVDHFVSGPAAAICDACITGAQKALESAVPHEQLLVLPPRVFGTTPPDSDDAIEQISYALNAVFGPGLGAESTAHLEDGEQLMAVLLATRARHPSIHVTEVLVERVRFWSDDGANVGFALLLDSGQRISFRGRVVRADNRWVVTRDALATVVGTAGVTLPPQASSP